MVYGSRRFFSVFAFVLAAFTLFGPITPRNADHNAYRYLLGPFACSLVALAMHLLFRFNPYRWNRYRDRSLSHLDERDEDARRLVEIIGQPAYVQTVLRATAWLAVPWFLVMAGCTLWLQHSLNWRPVSSGLFFGVVGGVLFAWVFIRVQIISWALSTWWSQYGDAHPEPGSGTRP
jgi:hypothetical protein